MFLILQTLVVIYILCMFILLMLNYRGYKELPLYETELTDLPSVSMILPTDMQPEALRNCLSSLARQDYDDFEILVIDDQQNPENKKVIEELRRDYSNIRHEVIESIPEGWSRNTYQSHQGALKAKGDYLVFVIPRVDIQPQTISRCIQHCIHQKIDMLCLMPGQELKSFWDKLILPITFGWFGTRFSLTKVNDPNSTEALGIQDFMIIRKSAYQASGGFQKVRHEILEDSALAREIKSLDLRYRLEGGKGLLKSRVYGGLNEIWDRWERIFIGEVGSSAWGIFWNSSIIFITGVLPFISILWIAYFGLDQVNPLLLSILTLQCIMVLSARIVLDMILGIGILFAFLQPVGALFTLMILLSGLYHNLKGYIESAPGRIQSEL